MQHYNYNTTIIKILFLLSISASIINLSASLYIKNIKFQLL